MIADWAPPLLILGLTPAMRSSVARAGGKPFAVLTRPRIALPVWLVGWYAIHLALFYDFALEHAWTLNIEHLLLIAIGIVFWWPVLADEPVDIGAPVKIGYLGAAFVGATFLGLGLTFASTPFYDFYADAPRLWGISAERDQNFGGILMNVEQAFVFLAAILYFVWKLIPEEEETRGTA
jgi:cytochrome c oxidase assembly factor CtaG